MTTPTRAKRRGVALGDRAGEASPPALVPDPAARHEPFPLADLQQAYWLGRGTSSEMLGGVAGYFYYEVESATLELDRLARAWRKLVERHDALRLHVLPDGRQQVLAQVPPYEIRTIDLRAQSPAEASAVLAELRDEMSHQVLDPERWPLFDVRAALLPDRVRVFLGIDGLLLDGMSLRIVLSDLGRLYDDAEAALPPLPEATFRDYVVAEHALRKTAAWQESFAYWRKALPELPPAPDLPLARERTSAARSKFVRYTGRLDAEQWARFQARVARAGLTPSGVLLAVYAEVLACWSSTPRFTINVAFLNRLPLHPRVDEIVGDLSSFLLVDVDARRRDAFEDRARRLQKKLWKDLPHAWVGGVEVLRELNRLAGHPVSMPIAYTSVLNQKGSNAGPSIGDLGTRIGELGTVVFQISQTPQVLLDLHVFDIAGGLGFNLDAVEDRFAPGVCEAMFGAFQRLVERIAGDEQIWKERAPEMLPTWQIELQRAINDTAAAPIPEGTLTAAIVAQAERRPDALAVAGQARLTYGELVQCARRIARSLTAAGAAPEARIGIAMEKGWEQLAAVLGVLEAGMAYVPLDPASPPARLELALATAGVALVLTQRRLAEALEWPAGLRVVTAEDACADASAEVTNAATDAAPLSVRNPDAIAMVLFTSGTMGPPRGVLLSHRGPLNAVLDLSRRFGVTSEDRLLSLTPLQHGLAAYDLFGMLGAGGTLVLPRPDAAEDPAHWLALLTAERVTVWCSTPAAIEALLDHVEQAGARLPDCLRLVMVGGDFLPLDLPRRLAAQVPAARLVSLGGSAETSIISLCYPVDAVDPQGPQWTSIPYGRPLAHQRVYVLDDELDPRPVWVPGQIWSAGLGLAEAYAGDDEATRSSFLQHPRTGERLHRTGDRGLYRPDGNLEILGRADLHAEIDGAGVEPAAIERVLRAHPHVKAAAAMATGAPGERRALVAYVVGDEHAPTDAELSGFLAARLPPAMVPKIYVRLDELPRTPSGKIDRRALPAPPRPAEAAPAPAGQLSPRQQLIQEAIAGVLEIDGARVGPTEAFFDLGGDSLRAVLIQSKLREKLGVEVPLSKFFEPSTLLVIDQAIAEAANEAANGVRRPAVQRRADLHTWPLSSAQARLLFLEQIAPGAPIWNLAFGIRLQGALDVAALEATLREIKRRHETLRATFTSGPGNRPSQTITPDAPLQLQLRDLSGLPAQAAWADFTAFAAAEARRGFDLAAGPLQREVLVRFAPDDHALVIIVHHLSADAWSFGVILRELQILYGAFTRGRRAPLRELEIQYADYAAWELRLRDDAEERNRARYWRDRLAGAPPFLSLPTDRARPATMSYEGALHPIALAASAIKDELRSLCSAEGATPFMALLAAYAILLCAWSGQRDVVIGAPLANRKSVETEALVGCFVNMIPLRVDLAKARSFRELLRGVKADLLADMSRELSFDQLVRAVNPQRSAARTPVFQVVLQLDAMAVPSLRWPGLQGEILPLDSGTARYELAIRLIEEEAGFTGQMNYRRDLWDPATMDAVARTFAELLAHAVRDPDTSIAALEAHAAGLGTPESR